MLYHAHHTLGVLLSAGALVFSRAFSCAYCCSLLIRVCWTLLLSTLLSGSADSHEYELLARGEAGEELCMMGSAAGVGCCTESAEIQTVNILLFFAQPIAWNLSITGFDDL